MIFPRAFDLVPVFVLRQQQQLNVLKWGLSTFSTICLSITVMFFSLNKKGVPSPFIHWWS